MEGKIILHNGNDEVVASVTIDDPTTVTYCGPREVIYDVLNSVARMLEKPREKPDCAGYWWYLKPGEKHWEMVDARELGTPERSHICLYCSSQGWGGHNLDMAPAGQWLRITEPLGTHQ